MHRTIAPPTKLFDQGLGQTLWLKGSKIRDLGFHVQVDRGFDGETRATSAAAMQAFPSLISSGANVTDLEIFFCCLTSLRVDVAVRTCR